MHILSKNNYRRVFSYTQDSLYKMFADEKFSTGVSTYMIFHGRIIWDIGLSAPIYGFMSLENMPSSPTLESRTEKQYGKQDWLKASWNRSVLHETSENDRYRGIKITNFLSN